MRLILVAAAVACAAPRAGGYTPARDCTGPEYRRLDFWLGAWEVKDPAGGLEGDNLIAPIDGGCAVRESWTGHDGGTGTSLFWFDRALGRWKQVWVTSAGGWKEKTEQPGAVAGAVRFAGELPRPGGGTVLDRTTLTPLPDGRVRQVIEQSADGGATWKTWEGLYARRPPTPACANREFDFWLGEWEVRVKAHPTPQSAEWVEAGGENRITSTYGGCVIEERFRSEGPGGFWSGHSVSMFQKGKWRQTWVDDSGSYLVFTGGWDGKEMELRGEPQASGAQMRMVFTDLARDALHWRWERTTDGGKSWTPVMLIDYRRRFPGQREGG